MSIAARRVRRTMLFVPGDDRAKIEAAIKSGADSIILDLEDGVALSHKELARQSVVQALHEVDFGRCERLVRINAIGSGLESDDLTVTLPARPDGIVIPKVDSADDVTWVAERINASDRYESWEDGSIRLLAMIETPLGVVNLKSIASADRRMEALLFGSEDFAGAMGAIRTKGGAEIMYARSAIVTHAAAYDLQAIDTVNIDMQDIDSLRADAERAAQMGYSGKLALHPDQVAPITQAFIPTDAAIDHAQRLIDAFQRQQESGLGAFAFEGKMIDRPTIRSAQWVLDRARAAGKA